MKTSTMKPAKPTGGAPLPEGARHTSGSRAVRDLQGAKHPGEVVIGKSFVANPKGSKPLVVGKRHVRVEGDKPRSR